MPIANFFLRFNPTNNKEEAGAKDDDGGPCASSATTAPSPPQMVAATIGGVGRLRLGAQSAMNHLIYGKWRKYMDKMPRLDGVDEQAQIWLLGRAYAICTEEAPLAADDYDGGEDETALKISDEFLEDFRSRIWLSYRERFPPLQNGTAEKDGGGGGENWTTDCGWGCTLRCAQMMLANVLIQLRLGRAFCLSNCSPPDHKMYTSIIRLFEDCPFSPLGLHSLLEMARRRKWAESTIRRWYSPSQAAFLLRDALLVGLDGEKKLSEQLCLAVCPDNCVVLSELREMSRDFTVPMLLIIPLRLGTESVNNIYMDHIECLFTLDSFVGMIGGRPNNAAYLIGCIEKVLLSLDPHVVQSYRPLDEAKVGEGIGLEESKDKWSSFNCDFPSTIPMDAMDPSCALGFLIRDESELDRWTETMGRNGLANLHITDNQQKHQEHANAMAALFSVLEKRQKFDAEDEDLMQPMPIIKKGSKKKKKSKGGRGGRKQSEGGSGAEFEVL